MTYDEFGLQRPPSQPLWRRRARCRALPGGLRPGPERRLLRHPRRQRLLRPGHPHPGLPHQRPRRPHLRRLGQLPQPGGRPGLQHRRRDRPAGPDPPFHRRPLLLLAGHARLPHRRQRLGGPGRRRPPLRRRHHQQPLLPPRPASPSPWPTTTAISRATPSASAATTSTPTSTSRSSRTASRSPTRSTPPSASRPAAPTPTSSTPRRVRNYWSPEAGLVIRLGDNGGLRIAYQGDFAGGFRDNGGVVQLFFGF